MTHRSTTKAPSPPVAPFKVGDRVTCVRGFERSSVLTGTRWSVTSVGKTTIGIKSEHMDAYTSPGMWPAVRFALAPKVVLKPVVRCEQCGGAPGFHYSECADAGL